MVKLFGLIPLPSFQKLTNSRGYRLFARQAFDRCDVDNNKKLNVQEVYIALLLLYDQLNHRLPCHLRVPKKEEAIAKFVQYDADKDGTINLEEFMEMSRDILNAKSWRESIWLKIGMAVVMKTALWPLVANHAKLGMLAIGVPGANLVPVSALCGGMDATAKTIFTFIGFSN